MSRIVNAMAGVLLTGATPVVAQGPQPAPIIVSADAAFLHRNSGITLPPTLIGMARTQVREFEAPQLDIVGNWFRGDDAELSVYVFRSTIGSVPVWFDRAAWAVEMRGTYGKPALTRPPVAVRAPNAQVDGGLLAGWTVSTGPYKGTAVAIVPMGDWLVKLRYSSKDEDGPAAAGKLRDAIAGLGWPATMPPAAPAAPVADCKTPIAFADNARSLAPDPTVMLMGAFGSLAAVKAKEKIDRTPTWCRDTAGGPMSMVYRANGAADGYLLALSDAGRGVSIYPSVASQVQSEIDKKPRVASWSVDLVLPGRTLNFPLQETLPSPARAMELLKGQPMSSATTWGDKPQITLPSNFGKK